MIVRGVVAARRRPCLLSDPLTPGPGGSPVDEVLPAPDPAPDRRLPRRRRARWTTPGRPTTPSARRAADREGIRRIGIAVRTRLVGRDRFTLEAQVWAAHSQDRNAQLV